ncbi:MAG: 30S ribosomal protein S19e [Nanoarchaeota archaeon]
MVSVKDVDSQEFIEKLAETLEKTEGLEQPEWSKFVKTGVHKERPPEQKNWWWLREASIMRKLYLKQNLGVSKFRKLYGGRKNLGHQPEHKRKASGAIIRRMMQQMETKQLIKKDKKGRALTAKGKAFMNEIAKTIK